MSSQKLGISDAILGALLGRPIGFYPRNEQGQRIDSMAVLEEISKIALEPEGEKEKKEEFSGLIELARQSLDEVKELTEYQDQKISRLLTIVAFLTAAAGTVFSKTLDLYPIRLIQHLPSDLSVICLVALYLFFFLFILAVAFGAMVSFHAIETRFLWEGDKPLIASKSVKSLLFFRGITGTMPDAWVRKFVSEDGRSANKELPIEYYKNYVAESYLVAAKVADKLRYLEPAQKLLLISIRLLVIWLIFLACVIAFIPAANDRSINNGPISSRKKSIDEGVDLASKSVLPANSVTVNCGSTTITQNEPTQTISIDNSQSATQPKKGTLLRPKPVVPGENKCP